VSFAQIPGQHLLYTLFEAPSNLRLPVLVIGLTESYDFLGLLEKRVKSRFSQYTISAAEQMIPFERYVEYIGQATGCRGKAFKNAQVQECLQRHYLQSENLHPVLNRLVSALPTTAKGDVTVKKILEALSDETEPAPFDSCTTPMLHLLVAIFRIAAKSHGLCKISFEAVLQECSEMARMADIHKTSTLFKVDREALLLAWSGLEQAGIITRSNANSWLDASIDSYVVSQPLTDLHGALPDHCPEHLRSLACCD
jgi:hypothetical protein